MREFEAPKANNKFGHLLDMVEHREEVVITRHGKEIARLVPAHARIDREEARAVIQRIRARAERANRGWFDWAEWKAYCDEGAWPWITPRDARPDLLRRDDRRHSHGVRSGR
jgi:prevent-host-death family protein